MSFSEIYRITGSICRLSRNGGFIASCFRNNVTIRVSKTGELLHSFTCPHLVDNIEWSSDSEYVLCSMYGINTVQVFSMANSSWKCTIREGNAGIIDAYWSPDGRHVLTTAEFCVWVCIWSLVGCSVFYIHNVKSTAKPAVAFSDDGKLLAVIEDHFPTNVISLFNATTWKMIKQIPCDGIQLAGGISWSPNSTTLCIWDDRPDECFVKVLSASCGSWQRNFNRKCLGVKTITWSPSGQLLAVGCFSGTVFLINYITWTAIKTFEHDSVLSDRDVAIHHYSEKIETDDGYEAGFVTLTERPIELTVPSWETCDLSSVQGVSLLKFSSCGKWLVTVEDRFPALLWIWNIEKFKLTSVLVLKGSVKDVSWDPSQPRLAAAVGTTRIFLWDSRCGVTAVKLPCSKQDGEVKVTDVTWDPFGRYLLLAGKTRFIVHSLPKTNTHRYLVDSSAKQRPGGPNGGVDPLYWVKYNRPERLLPFLVLGESSSMLATKLPGAVIEVPIALSDARLLYENLEEL